MTMKIRVVSVQETSRGLKITFADRFHNTDMGNRALRILYKLGKTGYEADLYSITLPFANDNPALNTRKALQATFDRHSDQKIRLTFDEVVVFSQHGSQQSNMKAVQKTRDNGGVIRASMRLRIDLPVTTRDLDTLRDGVVPGGVYHIKDDAYGIVIDVWMQGDRENLDPWAFMEGLKPKIRKVIV